MYRHDVPPVQEREGRVARRGKQQDVAVEERNPSVDEVLEGRATTCRKQEKH